MNETKNGQDSLLIKQLVLRLNVEIDNNEEVFPLDNAL